MLHESPQDPEGLLGVGQEVGQGELVDGYRGVGEVRVELEAIKVADHQERWVVQGLSILEKLGVGSVQVLALALVLPGEVPPLPHVGEPFAALHLTGPLLEGIRVADRVGLIRRRDVQHPAQVDEVFLRGGPLGAGTPRPLLGKLSRCKGVTHVGPPLGCATTADR